MTNITKAVETTEVKTVSMKELVAAFEGKYVNVSSVDQDRKSVV